MALSPHMNIMLRAIEKAGRSLVRDFGEVEQLQVSRKGPGDFVSAADRRAEDILFGELSKSRPEYGFLMEESGEKGPKDAEYRWIIDPLDGTMNFLHGVPHWCISLGLECKGEMIAGVVFDPVKDETFRAEKGQGAFMRNTRLRVSGRNDFGSALFSSATPPLADKQALNHCLEQQRAVASVAPSLRSLGSAALDMAYLAAGRFDGLWINNAKPWDIAAGAILIKEAGGMISDTNDKGNPVYTGNVVAANPNLFGDLKQVLRKAGAQEAAA